MHLISIKKIKEKDFPLSLKKITRPDCIHFIKFYERDLGGGGRKYIFKMLDKKVWLGMATLSYYKS